MSESDEEAEGMQVNEIHVDEYFCPACGSENNNGDIGCPEIIIALYAGRRFIGEFGVNGR